MMAGQVLSFQFDDVVVDLRAGRVSKGGEPRALEPKAFDLLVLLASRAGSLVTKQDVLDEVWAGVYVTDNAVARVVAQVRRALGDTARGARYIETVPTRGYRFIATVTRQFAPEARATSTAPPAEAGSATLLSNPWAPGETAGGAAFEPTMPGPPPGPALSAPPPVSQPTVTSGSGAPTSHPVWAAAFFTLALVALFLAWRSSRTDGQGLGSAPLRLQLTSSAALDAFPAWSPDGEALAYASDRSGRFEIFIRDITAGGDRVALTNDGQHNVQPAWSPDGKLIAYHSPGRGGIWIISRSGGAPRQVSAFGSRPAWSPDGTRLAFQGAPYTEPSAAAFETFGPSSIWIVPAAGGTPQRVTSGWRPEGSHSRPTWFPDGQRLLFGSQGLESTTFWTVDLPSGALTRVLDTNRRALDPTLTPDGTALFYVGMDAHFDLWKLPLTREQEPAGPPQLVLPPSELDVRHVAIHPAGQQIAYVGISTVSGLRSLPLHRGGVPSGPSVRLAEDAVRMARRPSFSPDARLVAFERQSAGVQPALWLFDLAQGAARVLARASEGGTDPVWSADGREVFYVSGRGEQRTLRAVRPADGATRDVLPLTTGDHMIMRPRLSPDGTRLAYTRSQEGQLEVWVRSMVDGTTSRVARLGDGVAFPIWSPDGGALAVDVWRDGHAQAHVVDLASGVITQVSQDVEQAWVRSWSPDGRHLAFAAAREGRWNVYATGRDGAGQRQLTAYGDEHHYVRNPEWWPRGDRLVYEFASFSGNIWMIDVR